VTDPIDFGHVIMFVFDFIRSVHCRFLLFGCDLFEVRDIEVFAFL
jgi:hypothetical protein